MAKNAHTIIVPEMNLRQVFYEVQRVAGEKTRIMAVNKVGGGEMITPEELLQAIKEAVKP